MHKVTDNCEFHCEPYGGHARWHAWMIFYKLPQGDNVKVDAYGETPDRALAALWVEADRLGYW